MGHRAHDPGSHSPDNANAVDPRLCPRHHCASPEGHADDDRPFSRSTHPAHQHHQYCTRSLLLGHRCRTPPAGPDTGGPIPRGYSGSPVSWFDLHLPLKRRDSTRGGHSGAATPGRTVPRAGTSVCGHRGGPIDGVLTCSPSRVVSTTGCRRPSGRPRPRAGPSTRHTPTPRVTASHAGAGSRFICPRGPRYRPRGKDVMTSAVSGEVSRFRTITGASGRPRPTGRRPPRSTRRTLRRQYHLLTYLGTLLGAVDHAVMRCGPTGSPARR